MKIHEYQARQILSDHGIAVPAAEVVRSPEAAARTAEFIGLHQTATPLSMPLSQLPRHSRYILIAVSDDAIARAAMELAAEIATAPREALHAIRNTERSAQIKALPGALAHERAVQEQLRADLA